jgi:glycine oxidase
MLLLEGPVGAVRRAVLSRDQYLIPRADGRVLLGSTVEEVGFDARVTAEGARFLLDRLRAFAPGALELTLAGQWAGLRPGTTDRLPYLGRPAGLEGLIVACGHFRNGVLLAPVTGRIVADLCLGRPPVVDLEPFRVGRPAPA